MDLATALIQVLNAVQYGFLLFLVASGLTLIFGIMGVINLAHGSFYMIGAYLAFSLAEATGDFWSALALGTALALLLGLALERTLIRALYARDHLDQVLLTYGLILALEEIRALIWGNDVHGVTVPALFAGSIPITDTLSYPIYRLFMTGVCAAVAIGMALMLTRTRLGQRVRAGAVNPEMTLLLGIDLGRVQAFVFALGAGLAAFAGMIAAPAASVYPGMGDQVLIISFVVVVIGGLGSVRGALIAAMSIGLADTFGKVLLPEFAGTIVYLVMALVLIWRPSGLLGRTA